MSGPSSAASTWLTAATTFEFGQFIFDQTPVAIDKVRFVGDAVAAVAATDPDIAAEALGLIDVEYEELPAVFDAEAALAPEAPLIHEGSRLVTPGLPHLRARSREGTNIVHLFTQRRGDVDAAFRTADRQIERTYESQIVSHVALEPHNTVVDAAADPITVWTCAQNPHIVQAQIATLFRVPVSHVRVIVYTLGGGFGGKMMAKLEPIAALLSAKAGRPVQIVMSRAEDFLLTSQHSARIRVRSGFMNDGSLVAQHTECFFNAGPYADTTPMLIMRGYAATGPYRVPNIYLNSYGVYTNVIPTGAFRGYGITQVAWAHESQMDEIADALDMDPLELRLKNALRPGDPFTTGEPMPELHYPELLRDAAAAIGWSRDSLVIRDGVKIRAKGIAAIVKGMASPTTSSCILKLNADGSLNVHAGTVEMGQGSNTALAQIAADSLALALEDVRVIAPDTESTPFDLMTAASRSTYCMGMAIGLAAGEIRDQLRSLAADELEAAEADLEFADGRVSVRGVPDRAVAYGELVRRHRLGNLLGRGTFVAKDTIDGVEVRLDLDTGQGHGSAEWHPAVVGCEVEVDVETGQVQVTQLHASLYAGRIINPLLSELQVEGSAIFALGQALFEDVLLDTDGRVMNPNLSDYMIPSFEDVPRRLTVHLLQPPGVEEVHGLGETALPPTRAAIGNAVARAIGARITRLPLSPEKILAVLASQPSGERTPEPVEAGGVAR